MTRPITVAIPVYDDVNMLDVTGPFEMFDWAEFGVELVAAEAGPKRFRSRGFSFQVERSFDDAGQYDVIWIPGGEPAALKAIMEDPESPYIAFLRNQAPGAKYMCSVCEGALLSAASGLLDDHLATTHWRFIDCFPALFPKVKVAAGYPRFVVDRNRITGGGISSGLDEALELIRLLAGDERAASVQLTTQYYPEPPVTGQIPASPPLCPISLSRSA